MNEQLPLRFNRISLELKKRPERERLPLRAQISPEELRLKQCEAEVMAAVRRLIRDLTQKEKTA